MKRPVGVILVAIVVALVAGLQLMGAVALGWVAFGLANGYLPAQQPSPMPPQAVQIVIAATAFFFLLLAVWAVFTVIGLLKLKNWGRYSVQIMGGLMAFFGFASLLMMALVPTLVTQSNSQAEQLPGGVMQGIFLAVGFFYLLIAATGVWWLVYFNLASVKARFQPWYAAPPAYFHPASLATPGGLPAPPPPRPAGFSRVPASITVIACLMLLGALFCAGASFLPFPTFFAGVVLGGMSGHLLYAIFALAFLFIGVGLLRLDNRARLGFYALIALNFVNLAVLTTPWGHARQLAYNQQLADAMHLGVPLPSAYSGFGFQLFLILFIVLVYGGMIWLIERQRARFTPPAETLER